MIYVSVEQDGRETNHICQATFRAVQFSSQHVKRAQGKPQLGKLPIRAQEMYLP